MNIKIPISDSGCPKAIERFGKTGCMAVDVRTKVIPMERVL
jgi:hypothetical protein